MGTAVASVVVATVGAGAGYFFGLLKFRGEARWEMKRNACLKHSRSWTASWRTSTSISSGQPVNALIQDKDVAKARQAHSELWICCNDLKTITAFLDALGMTNPDAAPKPTGPEEIGIFRAAFRDELGLDSDFDPDGIESNCIFIASV